MRKTGAWLCLDVKNGLTFSISYSESLQQAAESGLE